MRVLVSVDMEGVAGVAHPREVEPGDSEYERNRHLMTAETNAAVEGALEYDPQAQVVVCDSHANARNIFPERLHRRALLRRGAPKPLGMMSGIADAEPFDAVLFVGYHGRAGTARSVISHTMNSSVIAEVRCAGVPLGEIGLNAALAAEHGAVPVLVTGDDTAATEATEIAPGIHTVVVKRALGTQAAESLHPELACERIRQAVPKALADRAAVRPPRFTGPVELEVDVVTPSKTEYPLLVPGMELVGGQTLRYLAPDYTTAFRVMQLVSALG